MSNQKIFEKSLVVFPGGVNSPVRSFQEVGISPIIVQKGKKDEIVDADGKKYIDYCMGWGSLILGHANPEITKQTLQRIKLGTSFGIATEDELKLGEEIKKLQPAIEKLRFVSTGTEATMTALRLARAFTGKKIIVKFNGN
ncbi:MAG TPA: aminotransferase class III-fold pyridoxal phosphate-dependent enzyme, partial [Chlamydiales bacterium]|nr:aminotransferase class III-fold pyridoxal phosphate-dependent enzyme [Chlamydiales bacterium]